MASEDVFSSEWNLEDGQKSDYMVNSAEATPILSAKDRPILSEADERGRMVPLFEPLVQFVTEYLTITVTESRLNSAHTATVIAENCLPADLHVPLCSSYPFPNEPIGPFVVHPLLPYSQANSPQPQTEDLTINEVMKRTVNRMRAQMRDLVVNDIQRMTDESGRTPQLFRRVDLPDSESPVYIREMRSVANNSHPSTI